MKTMTIEEHLKLTQIRLQRVEEDLRVEYHTAVELREKLDDALKENESLKIALGLAEARAERLEEALAELLPWASNWLPDEAKDRGARKAMKQARAILAAPTEGGER